MVGWALLLLLANGEVWSLPVAEHHCKAVPIAMAQGARVDMPFLNGTQIQVLKAACTRNGNLVPATKPSTTPLS